MSRKLHNTIPIIVQSKADGRRPPIIKLNKPLYKEDVLYDANGDSFLGEGHVKIVNKLNRFTNSSLTIATCQNKGTVIEKTSDNIAKLIGQRQYDLLISALCSVLSHELKIRGIYSLLTPHKKTIEISTQTDSPKTVQRYVETSTQTEETPSYIPREKTLKRRLKRQGPKPYVIKEPKEEVKKVVIYPADFKRLNVRRDSYEDCKDYLDENSNDSIGKLSSLSVETTHTLLYNPVSLLKDVDKHTEYSNSSSIVTKSKFSQESRNKDKMPPLSVEPKILSEDKKLNYHEFLTSDEQNKMLLKKVLDEWKYCNIHDEDGNLPLHVAIMDNDINGVKRQCLALKSRKISLDTPGSGKWTPLKMALYKNTPIVTEILLRVGADPLLDDEDDRNAVHLAAESSADHLRVILKHLIENARTILEEKDLWMPDYNKRSASELSKILLNIVCNKCDDQGYTPLMLASKLGRHSHVQSLLEVAPEAINKQMPTCGNTALYLAIESAYTDALVRFNKSKTSENFRKTVEALVENGADPTIDNHSGTDVNDLLTEFSIADLSMLVANKLTSVKFFSGSMPECSKSFKDYMVVKSEDDALTIQNIQEGKPAKKQKAVRTNPVIVENVAKSMSVTKVRPPVTMVTKSDFNSKLVIVTGAELKNIKLEVNRGGVKRKTEDCGTQGISKFKRN